MLLEAELLRRLDRLRLLSRRSPTGLSPGERRSHQRGRSLEFAEHREYSRGDDLRHLDWNAYARLEKLYVKQYQQEREQTVYLLVDGSASMQGDKYRRAQEVAAVLAYVTLGGYDRVGLGLLAGGECRTRTPTRGRSAAAALFAFLQAAQAGGAGNLDSSLRSFARATRRAATVIVVSDFLEEGGGLEALGYLQYLGHRPHLVQVLSPEERDPALQGDLRLVDVETAESRELTVSDGILQAYRLALQEHRQLLQDFGRAREAACIEVCSRSSLADEVVEQLRRGGLLA